MAIIHHGIGNVGEWRKVASKSRKAGIRGSPRGSRTSLWETPKYEVLLSSRAGEPTAKEETFARGPIPRDASWRCELPHKPATGTS